MRIVCYGALHNAMPVKGLPPAARNGASSLVRPGKGMGLDKPAIGLLGLGSYFRRAYLSLLSSPSSPFQVAALCRRNWEAMKEVAVELGQPALYTRWQEFMTHPGLDAVLISTPHHLHYQQVRMALENGLHVLVDKPLCLNAGEAEELVGLAHRRPLVLSVAYNYHYWSHFQAARELILSGEIGRITSVTGLGAARGEGSPILDADSWYHEPAQSGGGSMASGGTHRLEAIFWLTGLQPRSVFAVMRGPSPQLDYQAGLVLELAGGAVATLLNEAQGPEWQVEFSIYGEGGALLLRNQELTVVGVGGREAVEALPPETDALSDFCAAIVDGKPLLASAEDGYWGVAAVQAAYESAASGQPRAVRQPTFETS
jgi:predicted dehydrogenase